MGRGAALGGQGSAEGATASVPVDPVQPDQRLQAALHAVVDGVVILDPADRFVFANHAAGRMLGEPPDRLVGRTVPEVFSAATGDPFDRVVRRALGRRGAEPVEVFSGRLGSWLELRVFPMPDGLALYLRDVGERRAADSHRATLARRAGELLRVTEHLAQALTLDDVAAVLMGAAREALTARFGGVAVLSDDRQRLLFLHPEAFPVAEPPDWANLPLTAESPAARCVVSRRALFHRSRAELLEEFPSVAHYLTQTAGAWANLPLVSSNRVIGVLSLAWPTPQPFDVEQRWFLQTIAGQTAQTVERAQLFARQRAVADSLQQAVLPTALPAMPTVELGARYQAVTFGVPVGGDWYDAFLLRDGRLALVVGDVGGHGLRAAAAMGQLRNALRGFCFEGHPPATVMGLLSGMLAGSEEELYATAVLAIFDPATGEITWCNAGHPPPVLSGGPGRAGFLDDRHGTLLGALPDVPYGSSTRVLPPSALLVLYTDGLIETPARSLTGGLSRLRSTVAALAEAPMRQLCEEMVTRVAGRGPRADDLCVLAVRRITP